MVPKHVICAAIEHTIPERGVKASVAPKGSKELCRVPKGHVNIGILEPMGFSNPACLGIGLV